jgi:hypothetical protein
MTTEAKKPRQMPKGGRKGGTVFPRSSLTDAMGYARKLVSKTHTGPQPKDVILSGVIGVKGGIGEVRMSALKQYGFLKGDTKSNFSADELAKQIAAAPQEELVLLYRRAMLKPAVFKKLFETFHGDTVTKAKLKQRAADLNVHPDETETCVDLYVAGMTVAGLVSVDADRVTHVASSNIGGTVVADDETGVDAGISNGTSMEMPQTVDNADIEEAVDGADGTGANASLATGSRRGTQHAPRAVFNVNVTLDSSMDIEKLQKQLELLKRFGAI